MSDLIIIKSGINVKADVRDHWHKEILKMKETGVIVLPWFLDAEVVPEDIEIKFEDFDVDKYIKDNYRPVEDKPGYVWFDQRNMQMISIDVLKASMEDWSKCKEVVKCQASDQN